MRIGFVWMLVGGWMEAAVPCNQLLWLTSRAEQA